MNKNKLTLSSWFIFLPKNTVFLLAFYSDIYKNKQEFVPKDAKI